MNNELFSRLWTQAQPAVTAYLYTVVPLRDAVDDLVQEAAVAALRRFSTYDQERSFTRWAVGIARNEVLMHRRSLARRPLVCDTALVEQVLNRLVDRERDDDLRRRALRHCLGKLAPRARKVVAARYERDASVPAVAADLGTSEQNVHQILSRSRAALRRCIDGMVRAEGVPG